MPMDDELAAYREVRFEQMHKRNWILLGKHINGHLYDAIHSIAAESGAYPSDVYHFTSPEEASERPLAEPRLRLVTSLAMRADSKSRLVNEFVKAAGRKFGVMGQTKLPLAG